MKKISVVISIVILLVLTVVPAFAAGGPSANRGSGTAICTGNQAGLATGSQARYGYHQAGYGMRNPYALSGTITVLDANSQTVSVNVSCGNGMVNSSIGTEVTIQTTQNTRFLLRNEDGTVTSISFADLVVGESVSSHGSLVDGVWTASRVTMGALLSCVN